MAGTKPLADKTSPSRPASVQPNPEETVGPTAAQPAAKSPRIASRAPPIPTPAVLDPQRPVGIDRRSWLRLKRGKVEIEDSVDLHGLTQQQAHSRLDRFLADAQRAGLRCVLVVTGKGLMNGGVLRHMVPRWLNEGANRERVVAFLPAQPKHGGGGALYLLIRRRR